ncbi:MAG: hypothetical protein GY798_19655 [Hyphomicrobiales bacterium]|nr:hypothetical protein [Hyphomicrobiales bacterium]
MGEYVLGVPLRVSFTAEGISALIVGACGIDQDYDPTDRPDYLCPTGIPKPQNGVCP